MTSLGNELVVTLVLAWFEPRVLMRKSSSYGLSGYREFTGRYGNIRFFKGTQICST